MGLVVKESLKGSAFLYLGIVLGGLNTTILFPQILGNYNWGVLSIIVSLFMLPTSFTHFGTPSIIIRYFPKYKDFERKKGLIGFVFSLAITTTLILCSIFLLFQTQILKSYEANWADDPLIISLIILLIVANTLFTINLSILNLVFKSSVNIFFKEFFLRAFQSVSVLAYVFFDLDFVNFLLLYAASYVVSVLLSFGYLLFFGHLKAADFHLNFSELPLKDLFSYGIFTTVAGVSSNIISNIDILMIGALFSQGQGEILAGKYRTGIYLTTLVLIPLRPIIQIMTPILSHHWKDKKWEEIKKLYWQSSYAGIIFTGLCLSMLVLNFSWISTYIIKNIEGTLIVILLYGLGQYINASTGLNGQIINISKHYRFTTYFMVVLATLNLALNYYLIPKYQLAGAAFATGFSFGIFNIIKIVFIYKHFKWTPFDKKGFYLFSFFSLSVVLAYFTFQIIPPKLLYVIGANVVFGLLLIIIAKQFGAFELLKKYLPNKNK